MSSPFPLLHYFLNGSETSLSRGFIKMYRYNTLPTLWFNRLVQAYTVKLSNKLNTSASELFYHLPVDGLSTEYQVSMALYNTQKRLPMTSRAILNT